MRTIEAQRASEAAALQRAKEAEAQLEAIRRDQMTAEERREAELEEAKKRAAEAEREAQNYRLRVTFGEAAVAAGLRPSAVQAAIALAQIERDDAGNPVNIDAAIAALKEQHDYLFAGEAAAPPPFAPGGTNAGSGSGTGVQPTLTPEQAAFAERFGLSPEQWVVNEETSTSQRASLAQRLGLQQKN